MSDRHSGRVACRTTGRPNRQECVMFQRLMMAARGVAPILILVAIALVAQAAQRWR